MKDLEEAAEEQNPLGLLPPNSDEDESVGASSTYGYTVTIPSKGDWAFFLSSQISSYYLRKWPLKLKGYVRNS